MTYTFAGGDHIVMHVELDDSVDAVALFNDIAAAVNAVLAQHSVSDDVACYAMAIVAADGTAVY